MLILSEDRDPTVFIHFQMYPRIIVLIEWIDMLIPYHIIVPHNCNKALQVFNPHKNPSPWSCISTSQNHLSYHSSDPPHHHHPNTTIPHSPSPFPCWCMFQKQTPILTPLSRLLTPAAVVTQLLQSHLFIAFPNALPLPHHICIISANRGPPLGVTCVMVCLVSL